MVHWAERVPGCSHHSTHLGVYYISHGGADRKVSLLIKSGVHFTDGVSFAWMALHFLESGVVNSLAKRLY